MSLGVSDTSSPFGRERFHVVGIPEDDKPGAKLNTESAKVKLTEHNVKKERNAFNSKSAISSFFNPIRRHMIA